MKILISLHRVIPVMQVFEKRVLENSVVRPFYIQGDLKGEMYLYMLHNKIVPTMKEVVHISIRQCPISLQHAS